jgi:hypothetical protein
MDDRVSGRAKVCMIQKGSIASNQSSAAMGRVCLGYGCEGGLMQKMEEWGIEPQAYRMRSSRSTPELHPQDCRCC